ncbi:hypothetical protein ABPG75_010161 [Micractinium tetrahymenae]
MPTDNPQQWSLWSACLCAQSDPSLVAYVNGPQIVEQCGCGPSPPPSQAGAAGQAQGGAASPPPAAGGPSAGSPPPAGTPAGTPGGAGGAPGLTQKVLEDIQASLAAAGSAPLEMSPPAGGMPGAAGPAPVGTPPPSSGGTSSSAVVG